MGAGTLTIYSASAGSGKTFQLARIYLSHLFRSRYNYRKILAVTFTNKATAEMKGRILEQLFNIATNKKSDYLGDIVKDTGKTEEVIRSEAGEILFHILHDFSRFSVSTIDSFFQKVLRAFTREAGLQSGFNIELDHILILESAVEETIASAADDPDLQRWLKDYVLSNLEEEKSWDLKKGIMQLSEELFRERFKILSVREISKLENKEFLLGYTDKLRSVLSSFEKKLKSMGQKALEIYHLHELSDDMFFQKGRGVPAYIRSLSSGTIIKPNNSVREIMKDPPRWSAKEPSAHLLEAISNGLEEVLREAVVFYDRNFLIYNSVKAVFSNIYALGILSDVLRRVRMLASSENSFLLSDAGEVLSLITGEDQTPFIYEKIGNKFENFMIDEFQDTSILQWSNFQPLIINSMGEGHDNLVVGDIKQSIYRWRNSDWRILAEMQADAENNKRYITKPLKTNWRSRANIIRFNNSLFSLIPAQVESSFPDGQLSVRFTDLYSESVQNDPGRGSGGYVRLEFIDNEYDTETETGNKKRKIIKKWDEIVLQKLPLVIETFLSKGYRASDIGILVRERREGEAVLRRMI
ncbi:MAG: UvrD-helicase domain-containing protein, partial [Bacteroidales bacterium]|nr:UvrD-helicase domain-containing protein [Bacteroidales bacterium]